jgi:hypothetical protein
MPAPALRGAVEVNVNVNIVWHDPVRFVATSGTLATDFNTGDTYDGLTLAAGDHFLYQPLTAGASVPGVTVGIYVVGAGAPVRRVTEDAGNEFVTPVGNCAVRVLAGTIGAGTAWICCNETAPAVGTDAIVFRMFELASGGGATELLDASDDIATYSEGSNVIATAGYNAAIDAGGMTWRRRTTTAPTTLSYFRRQDFGGVWYEAAAKRIIHGESLGIFGEGVGVDIGPALNEAIAWLGGKGGGRIILPPGLCYSNTDLLCDTSGIWIQGSAEGSSEGSFGTVFHLGADKTFHFGTAGGTERYAFKASDMKLTQATGGTAYFFHAHNTRNMKFQNLQLKDLYGFLHAGDAIAASDARMIFMESIEGGVRRVTGGSEHFIFADNMGALMMSDVVVEGFTDPGQSFIYQPYHSGFSANKPDGCLWTNVGASLWDYGLWFEWGIGNLLCTNSWFDRCNTTGLKIRSRAATAGLRFNNCHFVGINPPHVGHIGIDLGEEGNTISRFEISDSQICHWGQHAMVLNNSPNGISIVNNQFEDNCTGGTGPGLYPVVIIGGTTFNLKFTDNQIYRAVTIGNFAFAPLNGIQIDTTHANVEVCNNTITGVLGEPVVNPHRENPKTRKVYGNSGQVLEGTTQQLGPWMRSDIIANLSDNTMTFLGVQPVANNGHIQIVMTARGRLWGVWITIRGTIATPSVNAISVRASINGTVQAFAAALDLGESSSYTLPTADGIAFEAGDRIGMLLTTPSDYTASGTPVDVTAGLVVYYD